MLNFLSRVFGCKDETRMRCKAGIAYINYLQSDEYKKSSNLSSLIRVRNDINKVNDRELYDHLTEEINQLLRE